MTLRADLYWSFRSPYSWLAIGRYREMVEDYDLDIALKPVYPLAIRQPDFFARSHPNWLATRCRDAPQRYLGIKIAPTRSDRQDPRRGRRSALHLPPRPPGTAAAPRAPLTSARSGQPIWRHRDWRRRPSRRRRNAASIRRLDREAETRRPRRQIAANVRPEASRRRPTLVSGRTLLRPDRIDVALWRMKAAGLARRSDPPCRPAGDGRTKHLQPRLWPAAYSSIISRFATPRPGRTSPIVPTLARAPDIPPRLAFGSRRAKSIV